MSGKMKSDIARLDSTRPPPQLHDGRLLWIRVLKTNVISENAAIKNRSNL